MSPRSRTPDASCQRWYAKESKQARRHTSRMWRRRIRLWLRLGAEGIEPRPVRTSGWLTH